MYRIRGVASVGGVPGGDGDKQIALWRHSGGVSSLIRRGKVMGYLAGSMGTDPQRAERPG